jgi:hypothetical protein
LREKININSGSSRRREALDGRDDHGEGGESTAVDLGEHQQQRRGSDDSDGDDVRHLLPARGFVRNSVFTLLDAEIRRATGIMKSPAATARINVSLSRVSILFLSRFIILIYRWTIRGTNLFSIAIDDGTCSKIS